MAFEHLASLLRAVASLRAPGTLDPALVDALATLLLPKPEAVPARKVAAPLDALAIASRRVASLAMPDDGVPTPTPPVAPPPDSNQLQAAPPRRQPQDPRKLVALPSSWVQLAARADLDAPRSSGAGPARAKPQAPGDALLTPAPLESLFPAHRVRAILRDMTTRSVPSGRPDIAAAVRLIARAEPIRRLPQRVRTTLGHTIALLFDAGPAMLPFARDKQQLAATAVRLLGKDRVRVADFLGDPLRGVRPQRQVRWEALRWPARGSTLVLISDLGIGEASPEGGLGDEGGHAFLDECQRRGLRTVVLVPYPRERWPTLAERFDVALTWDLDTGVQALRRSVRQHR